MKQQLIDLRRRMKENNIDAYLIPTTDFHGSEYVNEHFKCREYISGFTGSAGTLIVTSDEAKLWTDGRYFLQAEKELKGSGIELMKMDEEGVPTVVEYIQESLTSKDTLGFDGRVVSCADVNKIKASGISLCASLDLVDQAWQQRPPVAPSKIYSLPLDVTGESSESKLSRLRSIMSKKKADYHLIAKLEDIAWLFNLRGSDVENTPVFFSFALISKNDTRLYIMDESFNGAGIGQTKICKYSDIFNDLRELKPGTILLDEELISYALAECLPITVDILNDFNPTELMKSIKNSVEIAASKQAHIRDGVAMVNFLYYLKKAADNGFTGEYSLSEMSAAGYLENCRRAQEGFLDLSFATISGYNDNGAVVHYTVTEESNAVLYPRGFLLVDSGGQYQYGTTDITRTVSLGSLTKEMRQHYTAVLKSNIALASARFPAGTSGAELDAIARKPLQNMGLDFNHGTGHGVGHMLSVHEGPNTISPRAVNSFIVPGNITSDEPGVYFERRYGIRLENEILCREGTDGLYEFEPITLCPFDADSIMASLLSEEEKKYINEYHRYVRNTLSPFLTKDVAAWLKTQTAPL